MKRLFLSMMAMAAMATTLTLTSCGSDNDGDNIPGDSSILAADGKTLKGNLIGKQTLEAGDYVLGGTVIIENGGELTIPAGTTIKAAKGFSSYIPRGTGWKALCERYICRSCNLHFRRNYSEVRRLGRNHSERKSTYLRCERKRQYCQCRSEQCL